MNNLFKIKEIAFILMFVLLFGGCNTRALFSKKKIEANAYGRHVELRWHKEPTAEYYKVLLSQNGKNFTERISLQDTLHLDFVYDPELGNQTLAYRILAISPTGEERELGKVEAKTKDMTDEEILDMVQYYTFRYFWEGAEPNSGMGRERIHMDGEYPQNDFHVVTTGGTGFGIFGILAGIDRGWISRKEGLERFQKMVDFLGKADRFHGIWPHWLDGETGKIKPFGENDNGGDLVESAFLMQGLLAVREYYKGGNSEEKILAENIDTLWREMEWNWYTRGGKNVLYWHWSPDKEWIMDFPLEGYNECLITYILAASSPTYPVGAEAYHEGWARSGAIQTSTEAYGYELTLRHNGAEEMGGPLFWAHYSYLGLNPKGLTDQYADYWEHNTNHTLINKEWCVDNPGNFEGYGEELWGLTASYSINGYMAHHPGNDVGVITPTAALSSLPYTPEESMAVIKNLYFNYGEQVLGRYGFYDALSPHANWFPQRYLAIDQGPIVAMIENHRSELGWKLFMNAPEIRNGLKKLGFQSTFID